MLASPTTQPPVSKPPPAHPPAVAGARAPQRHRAPADARDDRLGALLQRAAADRCARRLAPSPAGAALLQRLRDPATDRTKALAKRAIGKLGNNLEARQDAHLFRGVPMDGGAINPAVPCGLHAYVGGRLPAGVQTDPFRQLRSNKVVHQIRWNWAGNATTKPSTMFPRWMPPEHVRTLITLAFPVTRRNPVDVSPQEAAAAKRYITKGVPITIVKVGDGDDASYYPQF